MSIQFEAYIATMIEPYQIILRLSKELKLTAPIDPPWENRAVGEQIWYHCEVPLGLEGLPANIDDHIGVSIGPLNAHHQKSVTSLFDELGIVEQGQASVNILLFQPQDDNFSLRESEIGLFYEVGYLQVLRTMGALLRSVEGDCFLRIEDTPYCQFIRKRGEVIVDPTTMDWGENEKQALGVPLTIARIPEIH